MRTGIDDYYHDRGGNLHGLPVLHVGLNLQQDETAQTENFIQRAGLAKVLEDVNRAVASRFAGPSQPIFAVINGVANSPGHPQWQLLYSRLWRGETALPVGALRAAIDSVEAPTPAPPALRSLRRLANGVAEFTLLGQTNRSYRIEAALAVPSWGLLANVLCTNATQVIQDPSAPAFRRRFYRVVLP